MLDVRDVAPDGALQAYLTAAVHADPSLAPVAETVIAIAGAAAKSAAQIALGPLSPEAMPQGGSRNSDGDVQKALDLLTDRLFMEALATAPVAVLVSEELEAPKRLKASAPLVVSIDPLDGSSNIDANVSIGTIFSILPAIEGATTDAAHFMQPGRNQLGAGFVVYGPQTLLILSIGGPTVGFILDPRNGYFVQLPKPLTIAPDSHEYAINASNYRHWDPAVRAYITRIASSAKKAAFRAITTCAGSPPWWPTPYRIFTRGGVFLYPGDQRKGYNSGTPAPALRSQPDLVPRRACRWQGDRWVAAHSRHRAEGRARALASGLRLRPGGRHDRRISYQPETPLEPLAAFQVSWPYDGLSDVGQASHHLRHRLIGFRHDVHPNDVRADLPARAGEARLHRR